MVATLSSPGVSVGAFRPIRRVDARLWVGAGLGLVAAVGMLVLLSQLVPTQQEVLAVARDVPVGATLQASDLTSVRVRIPESMARDAVSAADVDRLVGSRVAVPLHTGHLLAVTDVAPKTAGIP